MGKQDSSSDDSSDEEEDSPPIKSTPAAKKPVTKKEESSSDSDSSDEEGESAKPAKPAAANGNGKKESSDSSDDDERASNNKSQQSSGTKRKAESSSSSESDSDEEPKKKKSKFATSTPALSKTKSKTPSVEDFGADSKPAGDSGIEEDVKNKFAEKKKSNTPFRRVVSEDVSVDPRLQDNSANTSFDTWGAKATQDLIVTKGKSFRHEKTKKKRGSYKGGPINTGVASIKFDD